jgi:hypothetical protein
MTRGKNVTVERAAAKLINSVPPEMRSDGMLKMGCYYYAAAAAAAVWAIDDARMGMGWCKFLFRWDSFASKCVSKIALIRVN